MKSDRTVNDKFQAFKNELLTLPIVQAVTSVEKLPTDLPIGNGIFLSKDNKEMLVVGAFYTDGDFFSTMGVEILAGRNFEEIHSQENMTLIVNETFLKKFNLNQSETIGKKIIFWGREMEIIGIMNDFHTSSFHKPIEPVMAYNFPETLGGHIMIKVSGDIRENVSKIGKKWEENFNHRPYEYSFLDSEYNRLYLKEEKAGQLIQTFTFLALFIGGLGLFGLSSYTAVQRSKEMSIRKVLGATVFSVIKILSRDYIRLILVAILISAPLGYYIMQNWLQNFVYKINIGFGSILFAGISVLILTILTVSYHAYQSAVVNPVENLRNE